MGLISQLTDFRPLLRVSINGIPLSGLAFSQITSCRVTDTAGIYSDTAEITWANVSMFNTFAMPAPGAEILIELGYLGDFKHMGLFVADEVEESSPPRQIRVTGRAKPQGSTKGGLAPLQQQKTRSWAEGMSLKAIAETIAGENGLRPGVTEKAGALIPGHIDQIDESDIAVLTRIAARFDLIAKPAGGVLFIGERGAGIKASGQPTSTVRIFESDLSRWAMRRSLGEITGTVIATYRDLEKGEDVEVKIGDKEPVRRLRQRFRDEQEARAVADAEARRAGRAKEALEVEMPGNPSIVAEGRLALTGCSSAADGVWLVDTVTHEISSAGYKTSARATPQA